MAVAKREGTTAYLVIKRHFTRILDISPEEITDFLYSDGVITLNDLEHATNKLYTSKDRTRKLIMSLQKAVKRNHEHFEHFCDYLIENKPALGYSEIAQTMKGVIYNHGNIFILDYYLYQFQMHIYLI